MSYVRMLVHAVFSTKNREISLSKSVKDAICEHIMEEAWKKSIRLMAINGHVDHLHCLISIGPKQCIADIMQAIKGESAYWFNNQSGHVELSRLIWQDDYFAVSVSESHAQSVIQYINRQEEHHLGMTYYQEVQRMAEKYGFDLKISS
ncbi:IS200/IS605 family transposase [Fibrella aquatica]|jgi:putative transposase|uniref:IS200/IS605 family transposase n=1 Tax=Fibrella aquatica TaxID=3242487 RepID=UPI00352301B1